MGLVATALPNVRRDVVTYEILVKILAKILTKILAKMAGSLVRPTHVPSALHPCPRRCIRALICQNAKHPKIPKSENLKIRTYVILTWSAHGIHFVI